MGERLSRATVAMVASVLILAMLASPGSGRGGDGVTTKGSIERLEGGMGPAGNGTGTRIEHAFEGTTSLVWGHEGPGDLRVVDGNLSTIGVLPLPSPGFRVKGASISEGGVRAFVWGSAGTGGNDTIITYNLTTFRVDQGYLPAGLVDLVRVDYVTSMAWGIILAVAGAHANGTSMLQFIETAPMQELKAYPLPGNASAQYLGTDSISLICLLDDGQLVVISTRDWSIAHASHALDGPFSTWYIGRGKWFLGGPDGTVIIWDEYLGRVEAEVHVDGPVQGIARVVNGDNETLVLATSATGGGSVLRAFRMLNMTEWRLAREEPWPVVVSMIAAHPTRGDAILVCGADGSVWPVEVKSWTDFQDVKRKWPLFVGVAVAVLLGAYGYFLWSRRKRPPA